MSTDSGDNDCVLCLSPLEPIDLAHPLQCPSQHCSFNCCEDCIERLIKSTKDDQVEASDGNTFRLFLHCPNCRNSHLGISIRDTLLLRKVDKYTNYRYRTTPRTNTTNNGSEVAVPTSDEQLSATELRFKYALEKDEDVASAVKAARQREDDFFGRGDTTATATVTVTATTDVDTDNALPALKKSSFEYLDESTASWNGSIIANEYGSSNSSSGGCVIANHQEVSIWSFDDEEGFEADLLGPRKSFVFRHHSMEEIDEDDDDYEVVEATTTTTTTTTNASIENVKVDPTLLAGLHSFMTDQEQQFLTAQFISGDTTRLAAATEMMHYVSALSLQGIQPAVSLKRRQSSNLRLTTRNTSANRTMLESVKEVIREGNEARRLEEEKEGRRRRHRHAAAAGTTTTGGGGGGGAISCQLSPAATAVTAMDGRRNRKRQVDMEVKKQMDYMKSHPLPLRMPKYAEVAASEANSANVSFLDDRWDGTVLDAFTKITIRKGLLGRTVTIHKQQPNVAAGATDSGIRRVIDATSGDGASSQGRMKSPSRSSSGKGYIDTEKSRVIVASLNKYLGRQGIVKGDVVSHFNGEVFTGTASDLVKLIDGSYEGELLTFVFNADSAVAEALKRRSMI